MYASRQDLAFRFHRDHRPLYRVQGVVGLSNLQLAARYFGTFCRDHSGTGREIDGGREWDAVPKRARWTPLQFEKTDKTVVYLKNLKEDVGNQLNKALAEMEDANPELNGVLKHIDFNATKGKSRLNNQQLVDLIHHFDKERLTNADFEFPDLLGL